MSQFDPVDPALLEEERQLRRLRRAVDIALAAIRSASITRAEAADIARHTRGVAIQLFPDKGDVYDLIIAPRLRRALEERFPFADADEAPPAGNA